jgi:hypothetical protein
MKTNQRKLQAIAAATLRVGEIEQPVLFGLANDGTVWSLTNPLEQGDKVWHPVIDSPYELFASVDDVLIDDAGDVQTRETPAATDTMRN